MQAIVTKDAKFATVTMENGNIIAHIWRFDIGDSNRAEIIANNINMALEQERIEAA